MRFIFLGIAILFFTSCDKHNYVDYKIDNQSDHPLQITFSYFNSPTSSEEINATVMVEQNKIEPLFELDVISPSVYNVENEDEMSYIFNIHITKVTDNQSSTLNPILRTNWQFREINDNLAELILEINNEDF